VRVRVGQSVAEERAELRSITLFTALSGVAVLALALIGGRRLALRTLRPIERMSHTAGSISEHDLSRRIDADALPRELHDLGATLNAAFARLEAAFERQARFTADASHEMRTPLAVVRAQAEHALSKDRSPREYREALEACWRATLRMTRVVEQLLALARADAHTLEVARERVELDELVREAIRETAVDAEAAKVSVDFDSDPVTITGDASLLHEVVSNLVSNAIRYNAPGGRVQVALHAADETATLVVSDDGEGIPAHALPHIFERFFRADPARSRERGGSGLGLAITRWIVEAHGGSITARSELGVGSEFTVTLPNASTREHVANAAR
jgi:heavy metal sensor kinase